MSRSTYPYPCLMPVPARYETLHAGVLPRGHKRKPNWDNLNAMKNVCHKVMFAKQEHFFLECEANPYGLICRGCPTFSHDGMCPHVMAVTHVMEQEKDEGDRDDSLDLHKAMATLDRVGQTEEGGGGIAKRKGGRKRKRVPRRGGRADGGGKPLATGTGVKKKGVLEEGKGKGAKKTKTVASPYEPPPPAKRAAQGHTGEGSKDSATEECLAGTGGGGKGGGRGVRPGKRATVGITKTPPATERMGAKGRLRPTPFTDIHCGPVGSAQRARVESQRARVERVKALTYDSGDGDPTLISGVARFLDMWQKDQQDAGMVAEPSGDWFRVNPLRPTQE